MSKHLFALALVAACAAARAQPYDAPPQPAAPRSVDIATPSEERLPNGLRVIVAQRRGLPLVTARLVLLSGSEVDPPQRAGLASLTAGLLTRGTRTHSAPALVAAAEALGGSLETGSAWNQSSVSITVTTPRLAEALALVNEVATQPSFAPAELERLRAQTLDDMKVAYSQPGVLASLTVQHALYGSGSYGHPAGGTPQSLPRITRADVQRLHATFYRPDNAVLVLAGDIDAATGRSLALQHFGAWKAPKMPLPQPAPASASPWPEGVTVIDMPGSGQAGVSLALPAIDVRSSERNAGAVTNTVLGGGYSSRLNLEVRVKRGLSYGAGSTLDTRRQAGALRVGVQTKNPSAAEVLGLVHAELDRLIAEPVPADELEARKATLIGAFSRSVETTAGLSAGVASLAIAGLPLSDLAQRVPQLQGVSAADVQAFAAKYFARSERRAVIAGEASAFDAALKNVSSHVAVVPQAKLDLESPEPPK